MVVRNTAMANTLADPMAESTTLMANKGGRSNPRLAGDPLGGTSVYPHVSMAREIRLNERHACKRRTSSPGVIPPEVPHPQPSLMRRCSKWGHAGASDLSGTHSTRG